MSGIYFSQSRNTELSSLEYIKEQLEANWNNVTIVKTFSKALDKGVNPPIVSIRLDDVAPERREIGSDILVFNYSIFIDIFATSDAQRIDLAHFITDKLKDGWTYNLYQHESGNPKKYVRTPNGRLYVNQWITNTKVNVGIDNIDTKERYRHLITVGIRSFKP